MTLHNDQNIIIYIYSGIYRRMTMSSIISIESSPVIIPHNNPPSLEHIKLTILTSVYPWKSEKNFCSVVHMYAINHFVRSVHGYQHDRLKPMPNWNHYISLTTKCATLLSTRHLVCSFLGQPFHDFLSCSISIIWNGIISIFIKFPDKANEFFLDDN